MSPEPVRVLVLYSHPLMGEGLGRMLAAEPDLAVDAVDAAVPGAIDAALAREPAVIVVEEGGAVDAAEVVRRSSCPVVLDVDINAASAWSLRRESVSTRPDDFLAAIRAAASRPARDRRARGAGRAGPGGRAEPGTPADAGSQADAGTRADPTTRADTEGCLHPAGLAG